jgi:hypothetical protein
MIGALSFRRLHRLAAKLQRQVRGNGGDLSCQPDSAVAIREQRRAQEVQDLAIWPRMHSGENGLTPRIIPMMGAALK